MSSHNSHSKRSKKVLRKLGVLRPPMPWHRPRVRRGGDETVILLHGLWRSVWAMEPMAQYLNGCGYQTINCPYASFKLSLSEMVEQFSHFVREQCKEAKKVHFVTHSLGGVVVRQLLQQLESDKIGHVVMLAPPHQGSEIVDWLQSYNLHRVLGPAGNFLSTSSMEALDTKLPDAIPVAVIMGKQSLLPFFRSMLDQQNDGIVSVERGQVAGTNQFEIIEADHTYISSNEDAMSMTEHFLRTGSLH
ncbi:esterase/lipase family protein [Rubritalea squalenifaciens]|nr:alpha/beta fold hydrolase [Rubritalea squalenifaciens]